MSRYVLSHHVMSYHFESRGTVTGPTLHCQLTSSTRNQFELSMTVFVGCPEGCRYHTASAVYDLVFTYYCLILQYLHAWIWIETAKISVFIKTFSLSDQRLFTFHVITWLNFGLEHTGAHANVLWLTYKFFSPKYSSRISPKVSRRHTYRNASRLRDNNWQRYQESVYTFSWSKEELGISRVKLQYFILFQMNCANHYI